MYIFVLIRIGQTLPNCLSKPSDHFTTSARKWRHAYWIYCPLVLVFRYEATFQKIHIYIVLKYKNYNLV